MKFTAPLQINKYNKSDPNLVLDESGIILVGVDNMSASLRLPTFRGKRYWVGKNSVAEFNDYIYFPADRVVGINDEYLSYPQPEKTQFMDRREWYLLKQSHPYRGGR